ncbi:TIGR04219 family outer membrane beta-barrel protein [Vibrio harveyi]|nr:TIGR04219 family outer membrane beta-barrel protein [Vibrio harveyi]
MTYKATIALATLSLAASYPCFAEQESSFTTTVGGEVWVADTKVNEVRRDSDTTGSFYAAIEHDVKYVPNARLRYSSVDADYMGFDKLDLTLYYQILEHDLMHFDAGLTFSNLSDTKYVDAGTNARTEDFDELIWAWYGYAEITVPNTNFDVIGEMNFGDNKGIKSTDLMAGVQYRIPFQESQLTFRAGYRVIDLESEEFLSSLGKEFIFADGFFVGAQYSF